MHGSSGSQSLLAPTVSRRLRVGLPLVAGVVALLSLLRTLMGAASSGTWALAVRSPLAAILLVLLCAALLAMERWPESTFIRRLTCAGAAVVALLILWAAIVRRAR